MGAACANFARMYANMDYESCILPCSLDSQNTAMPASDHSGGYDCMGRDGDPSQHSSITHYTNKISRVPCGKSP